MGTSNFLAHRAPFEVLYAIYQSIASERIQDAVTLSITCRNLRNQWTAHRSAILWDLCVEDVPHAREALLVARMTRKVADAEKSGRLPPMDIVPGDLLSGSASPKSSITLSEYQQVRALNLLAQHVEAKLYRYRCYHPWLPADRPKPDPKGQETVLPEEPSSMPEWSDRVRLSFYRTMIIAAGLAGAYHEPTRKAMDSKADMPGILKKLDQAHRDAHRHMSEYVSLTEKEVNWLEQFAVCNIDATPEAEEAVFGRLAHWLLGNILEKDSRREAMAWRFARGLGRATYCRKLKDSGRGCPVQLVVEGNNAWSHADAHLVVWELMQVLYVFTQILDYFPPVDDPDRGDPSRVHALVVYPGPYVVQERQMLVNKVKDCKWNDVRNPRRSVHLVLGWIHERGGRPNHYVGEHSEFPTPGLEYKFFEYFLRRYCKSRLDDDAIDQGTLAVYGDRELGIFANDHVGGKFTRETPTASNVTVRLGQGFHESILKDGEFFGGSEVLTSCDPPPARIYREMEYLSI
ncbi:hypothetical protein B0T20DRAFT_99861 [Sordaria brevicollis]|uniref:Uncharacterized protein n=1 Tax=Sordaria brevicollis TaxID=83679 RepID=A0AAE0NVX9_SORBR|nr:hypothetical protein B0T20DRAFT_99861 [Sordaria brevicollis]